MVQTDNSPQGQSQKTKKTPTVRPLTRRNYKRTELTQQQICNGLSLSATELIMRAQQRDKTAADQLTEETLVYFIRQADRAADRKTRDALIRELLDRCNVYFRSQFRGRTKEEREDLQGAVITALVKDLLDTGDCGDFMEVRFWLYLKRKSISANNAMGQHANDIESLDTVYSDDTKSGGGTKLDTLADERLGPEDLAMLAEAIATLPLKLRKVFLLRHYVGMNIGEDNPVDDPPNKVTLAQHYNCTGRTIRNWLKEAEALLAPFREK